MLDYEMLKFRSEILQKLRLFFTDNGYIELDTPSMSPAVIPDNAHEVFKATYLDAWTDENKSVFLTPSHEYFLKKAVASTNAPLFQLSKGFQNCVSAGRLNSPEYTLLEVYTPGSSYLESADLAETLIATLLKHALPPSEAQSETFPEPPFIRLSMDEAFTKSAGFPLSECGTPEALADKLRQLGIPEFPDNPFDDWSMDELFELLLSQIVEPSLPKDSGVFLMNCPSYVPSLAKEKTALKKKDAFWKECWTLYMAGTKVAVSRSEETDASKVKTYLQREGKIQSVASLVKPAADDSFWKTFEAFPECAGIELNVDRLIMLLARKKSVEAVLPFPFRLKTGYY